jgi:hypothetical protein
VNDQAIINESLCTENIVGRWTWKSGKLYIYKILKIRHNPTNLLIIGDTKTGSLIPWEN